MFHMKHWAAPLLVAGIIAHAGEWVTTTDGKPVCRFMSDLLDVMTMATTVEICTDWKVRVPQYGESLDAFPGWLRCERYAHTCQLHFEDGWRP